jgi:hypothetical protein
MSGVCAGPLAPRRVLQLRSGNSSSAAPALALFGSVAGLALAVGGLELLASSPLLCHSTVSAPLRWRRHASDYRICGRAGAIHGFMIMSGVFTKKEVATVDDAETIGRAQPAPGTPRGCLAP